GHVCESVTVTSLFTTLKYYPSNGHLFRDRLLRYARTVPCPKGSVLIFESLSIRKAERRFDMVPVAEYVGDARAGSGEERILDATVSVRAAHAVSPVHEGLRPGTYATLENSHVRDLRGSRAGRRRHGPRHARQPDPPRARRRPRGGRAGLHARGLPAQHRGRGGAAAAGGQRARHG